MQGKHTGNLRKHLRRHHKLRFKKYEKEEAEFKKKLEAARAVKHGRVHKKIDKMIMTPAEMKKHLVNLIANGRVLAMMNDEAFTAFPSCIQKTWPASER